MARFIVAPEWQGSKSSRAMAHITGAEAIAGDLPASACTEVDVPMEAGDALGSPVLRLSALLQVRRGILTALAAGDGPAIVIGGDCGVTVPAIEHVAGPDLAVVWLDAHPDLRDESQGSFGGMALRAVINDGYDFSGEASALSLPLHRAIAPGRIVLAGTRSMDDEESAYLGAGVHSVVMVDAASFSPESLVHAVKGTGASRVYIHIDLDVIDPASMNAVPDAVPFGLDPAEVVAAIRAVRDVLPLAGATIAGFAPATPAEALDDLPTILRLIGALAR
ncbi:MAG: arginase family protein [Microbacterium sp.]